MYKPSKGFFDLSNKPKSLDAKTHKKIQEIQNHLVYMQSKASYYKEFEKVQWAKGKEVAAQLQQIIFQYWPHEELFKDG